MSIRQVSWLTLRQACSPSHAQDEHSGLYNKLSELTVAGPHRI
jgi:hypothetical protein